MAFLFYVHVYNNIQQYVKYYKINYIYYFKILKQYTINNYIDKINLNIVFSTHLNKYYEI